MSHDRTDSARFPFNCTHVEADHGAGPRYPVGERDEGLLLHETDRLTDGGVELGAAVPREAVDCGGEGGRCGGGRGRRGVGVGGRRHQMGMLAGLKVRKIRKPRMTIDNSVVTEDWRKKTRLPCNSAIDWEKNLERAVSGL